MVNNLFVHEPDLNIKDRRQLAAYLDQIAHMAAAKPNTPDDLAVSFMRVLADRVGEPGPVSIRIGQLDEDRRLAARNCLFSARDRAKDETSPAVASAVGDLLAAWEKVIRY